VMNFFSFSCCLEVDSFIFLFLFRAFSSERLTTSLLTPKAYTSYESLHARSTH